MCCYCLCSCCCALWLSFSLLFIMLFLFYCCCFVYCCCFFFVLLFLILIIIVVLIILICFHFPPASSFFVITVEGIVNFLLIIWFVWLFVCLWQICFVFSSDSSCCSCNLFPWLLLFCFLLFCSCYGCCCFCSSYSYVVVNVVFVFIGVVGLLLKNHGSATWPKNCMRYLVQFSCKMVAILSISESIFPWTFVSYPLQTLQYVSFFSGGCEWCDLHWTGTLWVVLFSSALATNNPDNPGTSNQHKCGRCKLASG